MAVTRSSFSKFTKYYCLRFQRPRLSAKPFFYSSSSSSLNNNNGNSNTSKETTNIGVAAEEENGSVPTSGISRPLSHILKELNKKVPDSLLRLRTDSPSAFSVKYIPWHIVNRIMNLHAPEWSGEVRSITYSADGKSVSVVYRVTLYGTDAEVFSSLNFPKHTFLSSQLAYVYQVESSNNVIIGKIFRESTGTASFSEQGYGDPMQKAEAMAFRRACARFGLGLHLYHEDME
ncbi:hypothetical protein BUALT_Bualt08G0150200 [Buddleja alternifolia]|uniref:DNA repair RAD52-like protein 1, mitochondrial n=1 Tax=Buddleja alternifolia TaxID=168488 RepID=A0AAV6X604_9LAMI|nr:hypothetical protein BUALT_Bualt08G0150200 [Buddleja alternifolia]